MTGYCDVTVGRVGDCAVKEAPMTRPAYLFVSLWLSAAFAVTACSKDSSSTPMVTPPADLDLPYAATDDIWALAPANTKVAVVIGKGAGTHVLAGLTELESSLSAHPEGAKILREMRDEMRKDMKGDVPDDLLSPATHKQWGLDLSLPIAFFGSSKDDIVAIMPIADENTFMAKMGGARDPAKGVDVYEKSVCKRVSGRYACAESAHRLDALSAGSAMPASIATRPASMRGHIEVYIDMQNEADRPKLPAKFGDYPIIHGTVRLERGGFSTHWFMPILGGDAATIETLTSVPGNLSEHVAKKRPAGYWRVRLPLGMLVPPGAAQQLAPLVITGIDPQSDVIDNLTGELLLYAMPNSKIAMALEIGAKDGKKLQPLVDFFCDSAKKNLPAEANKALSISKNGERCKAELELSQLRALLPPEFPEIGTIEVEISTSRNALTLEMYVDEDYGSAKVVANPEGKALLTGDWHLGLWGYGAMTSVLQPTLLREMNKLPDMTIDEDQRDKVLFGIWLLSHLSEVGMGAGLRRDGIHAMIRVGSQWANPKDVLRDYQKHAAALFGGDESAYKALDKLARKSPKSPFGRSHLAGAGGGPMVATSMVGIAAAVAIPAFLKYIRRSQAIEGEMMVRRLSQGAVAAFHQNAVSLDTDVPRFPGPSVGPTPPLGTCCKDGDKCVPQASYWAHTTWNALQFAVTDPHQFSYQYQVADDGRSFIARALGDLDCDGIYSTFETRVVADPTGDLSGTDQVFKLNHLE